MPIEIVGTERGPERETAEMLKQILEPCLTATSHLVIVVGARCFGYDIQDLDLLLLGTFGSGLKFAGHLSETAGHSIRLVNIAVIVEVKDHSGARVRFDSQHVKVLYPKGWEDVTEKLFKQAKVLPRFLKDKGQPVPWIESLIWLRNYSGRVPMAISNVIVGSPTAEDFFAAIERIKKPRPDGADFYIAFSNNQDISTIQQLRSFFHQRIEPTKLDRKRLELICKRLISDQKYVERLGTQLLAFRGRGGSGKTVHLLRLAKDLYDGGKRVHILTFNTALVADIRRLLVILDISSHGFDRSVRISTAHSFFMRMMEAWGYWKFQSAGGDFPTELYDSKKKELLSYIANETPESLKQAICQDSPQVFNWDYVFVDEAQDWPEDERDLLFRSFGSERCVIADGVDQFIREDLPCDWTTPVPRKQIVPLRKAMRMGSSLCRFISAFASEAGVEWDQEINDEVLGGEVTIIEGTYSRELHDAVMSKHQQDGNVPVDALFCVPAVDNMHSSTLADSLRSWGNAVWDGTSRQVRETFPTTHEEHRVVKYHSCRGLEGWTVVCIALDRFYEYQLVEAAKIKARRLESPEEHARRYAIFWTLIPLTRAINHLVIQLDGRGFVHSACRSLADRFPDFVTWRSSSGRS